ncbi:MAG: TIGR00295 family protein [Candidatus Thermoplasmatota archaeon]|nr:TIGR00295 family protein [Candidatus Thermoplasmatota archaeon]
MVDVTVFRYGHRIARDKRITTHIALVARAFGARKIVIDRKDEGIEKVVKSVNERFGDDFEIETGVNWKGVIKNWDGLIVHLTMYGKKITDVVDEIKKHDKVLAVVGSKKVPGDFYSLADFNVAVGNQPHSEVAALAIFMHYVTDGQWMDNDFYGKFQIIPQKSGKKVIERDYIKILRDEGCSQEVINHSFKVQKLAMKIAEKMRKRGIDIDMNTVFLGSLFHDIGRVKTHGIQHIAEGAKIAKRLGLPEKVVLAIERHGGAGIDKDDAIKLGLPPSDYTPRTLEEEIIAHADNLTGNGYRTIDDVVKKFEEKAGRKATEKVIKLHEKLSELCGIDVGDLV